MKKIVVFLLASVFVSQAYAQLPFDSISRVKVYVDANILTNNTQAIKAVMLNNIYTGLINFTPKISNDTADILNPKHGFIVYQRKDSTAYVYDLYAGGRWRKYSAAGAGGGLTTGDKGDITVTNFGLTWTLDDATVTNVKIVDMAATKLTGTIADARLSSNVPLKDATNTFSVIQNYGSDLSGSYTLRSFVDKGYLQSYVNAQNVTLYNAGSGPRDTIAVFHTVDSLLIRYLEFLGTSGRIAITDNSNGNKISKTIDLVASGVSAGSCSNCDLTIDTYGRVTAKANGSSGGGGGYATLQEEGGAVTARSVANFIGSAITAADDGANTRTNITITDASNSVGGFVNLSNQQLGTGRKSVVSFATGSSATQPTGIPFWSVIADNTGAPASAGRFENTGTSLVQVDYKTDSRTWTWIAEGSTNPTPGNFHLATNGTNVIDWDFVGNQSIGGATLTGRLNVRTNFPGITADARTLYAYNSGSTFDATGAARVGTVAWFIADATKSAGAFNYTNRAFYATASGGDLNYAGIFDAGRVGVNVTAPTARLHVAAGTTAAGTAPIKINTGTAMTTPEDGAVEYHSSHLWFTIGSTRFQLDQQAATGISSLNGQSASSQSFATGTSGTDFGISSSGGTHTFNIPIASSTNTGKLSNTDWTTFNSKESALTFSTGLTRSTNTITANLSTGVSGGQSVIGGTGTTDDLVIQSTTANAVSGADIIFKGGNNGATEFARILNSGNFGIGVTNPTARIHLTAGTTSSGTAPIKINSGTAMTTPEDGAVEYHGSHLWFTIGSTRFQIDQQAGTPYVFSTGLTNSSNTITNNLSVGVSGGQSVIGGTGTTDDLIFKTTTGTGASGADMIFTGGSNGGTEFARILNDGSYGIGTATPRAKLDILKTSVPQLRLTYTDNSVYSQFQTLSSGVMQQTVTGVRNETQTGTTSQYAGMGGTVHDFYAGANVQGTEADMDSYTVPASTLGATGHKLEFDYVGDITEATGTHTIKVYFGGSARATFAIVSTNDLTVSSYHVFGYLIRTGSSTARFVATLVLGGTTVYSKTQYTAITGLTYTVDNVFKITGATTNGANGVVNLHAGYLKWFPDFGSNSL